jgi:DNA polymerase elongation subunit (family B)
MSALVLDIETVGQSVDELPKRALDYLFKNLERDAADAEDVERRREDMVARFGLDPTTGRVIVIGLLDVETGSATVFDDDEEKELLSKFWEWLATHEHERYVTFNGKRFDIPFMNIRSALHELAPLVVIPA